MLTIPELKLLVYTFGFLGEQGKHEIEEVIAPLTEDLKKDIDRRLELLYERNHLPVSCTKVKNEWEICKGFDCEGSITPIMHVCGSDPNVQLVQEIHLADMNADLLGRYVKAQVYVSGVGDPFTVPYLMNIQCASQTTDFCEECPFAHEKPVTLNDIRNELAEPYIMLEFTKLSKTREHKLLDQYIERYIRKKTRCPLLQYGSKPRIEVTIKKEKTITPLIVTPAIDEVTIKDLESRETARKHIYLVGVKRGVSRKGLLVGPVLKNPFDGRLTILGICFEPSGFTPETFRMRPEYAELFSILRDKPVEELVCVIGDHACKIYGRPDAVEANLIAYHVPLRLIWKGEEIPGWVQITNFGDTTTGKRIARMLKQFIGLGVYIIVETSGRTGLLYYIEETREGHILGFGEFVLADQTLVIIDGTDRMHKEEKAEFRESYRQGFLKVRRIVSGSAPMRVRVIACENVKEPLSQYMYPCESLLENYAPPDLARIDLAIAYKREDVAAEEIFVAPKEKPDWLETLQQALHINVAWSWSRRPEQVKFENGAIEEINKTAKKYVEEFGCSRLPLVSPDFDKKLAKLSAGYAALRHSTDETGELIVIKAEHVHHVAELIKRIYTSEGMKLDEYAKIARERVELTDDEYEEIKKEIEVEESKERLPVIDIILYEMELRGSVRLEELVAIASDELGTSVSKETIRNRMLIFKKHRLVVPAKGFALTAKGKAFLRRYKKEKEEDKETGTKAKPVLTEVREATMGICELCGEAKNRTHTLTVNGSQRYICKECASQRV